MNPENKEVEFLVIKREKSPEEEMKWQIKTDLYYYVECFHCATVFLIEESIDDRVHPEFVVPCPRCFNHNVIKKGQNRLLLKLKKIMKPNEINPWYARIIERSKREKENKERKQHGK